jgi:hypothetical protein
MKKHTFVFVSLLASLSSYGQEVIASQGDSYSTPQGNVNFTIGEVVINTGTDGVNDITQGFHQTNWNFLGIEDYAPDYNITIFPNPSSDLLNIQTNSFENVEYTLYDAQGKLVFHSTLTDKLTQVAVNELAPGNYSLTLNNKGQKLKTFKLTKIN